MRNDVDSVCVDERWEVREKEKKHAFASFMKCSGLHQKHLFIPTLIAYAFRYI